MQGNLAWSQGAGQVGLEAALDGVGVYAVTVGLEHQESVKGLSALEVGHPHHGTFLGVGEQEGGGLANAIGGPGDEHGLALHLPSEPLWLRTPRQGEQKTVECRHV